MITIYTDTIQNERYQSTFRQLKTGQKYNRRQSIVGHFLLADYLHTTVKATYDKTNFNYGAHGKPSLKNESFKYNIADSYDIVALAVSDEEIGADLEKIRPYDYHRIRGAFRPEELALLAHLSGEQLLRTTFKLWTVKEAVLKLTGMGLPGGVRSMSIDLAHFAFADRYGQKIKLSPFNIGNEYVGTIAQYVN